MGRVFLPGDKNLRTNPAKHVRGDCYNPERDWRKPAQPLQADVRMQQNRVVRAPPAVDGLADWMSRYALRQLLEHDAD